MNPIILSLIQILVVLAIAPFASGLVKFFKARLQGRKGASPFLPYWTYATLLKKQMVISETTSWIFRVVPFVVLASILFLAFVLPLLSQGAALATLSDMVLVAGMLALGAVFLVLGGLDPGSAFGGMGSSREMTIAALIEPAIIMSLATFALVSHSSTVDGMLLNPNLILESPFLILALIALVFVTLAENARYPVDNPATHLELTMVHEAMVLEYSGPYLAMLEYASSLKLTILSLLVMNFAFPFALLNTSTSAEGILFVLGLTVVKIIFAMGLLALLESTIAKMRFFRMQEYTSIAFLIALFAMISALIF